MNLRCYEPLIETALERIPGICLIYLFGSQLTSNLGALSDHDFGVLFAPNGDDLDRRALFAHLAASELGDDRIDVVSLGEATIELAYHIIATGHLLYEQDLVTRVEYEANVLGRYGDYLPILRQQCSDILQDKGYDNRIHRYRKALKRTERTLREITAAATAR